MDKQEKKELIACECCGGLYPPDELEQTENGGFVCQECIDSYYVYCNYCNALLHETEAVYVNDTNEIVCEDCLEQEFTQCEYCDEWFANNHIIEACDCRMCCDNCHSENYTYCDHCGCEIHIDDYFTTNDDEILCEDCYDERDENSIIKGYHSGRRFSVSYDTLLDEFYKEKKDVSSLLTFGIEIELVAYDWSEIDSFANDIQELGLLEHSITLENDSSLSPYGVEIITKPYTVFQFYEFQNTMRSVLAAAKENRLFANDTTGMHVHINKFYEDSYNHYQLRSKVMNVFLKAHYAYLEQFQYLNDLENVFGRKSGDYNKMNSDANTCLYLLKHAKEIAAVIHDTDSRLFFKKCFFDHIEKHDGIRDSGHGHQINNNNSKTIEFRSFASSNDARTVIDNVLIIFGLIQNAYKNSNNLDLIDFEYTRIGLINRGWQLIENHITEVQKLVNKESEK